MYFKYLEKNNTILFIISALTVIFAALSAYGILASPSDYLQGEYSKIMYVHVPSAWLSLAIFIIIATLSAFYLIFKSPVYNLLSRSLAPIGLIYNFTALFTGSLWGKPTWGTYWVWDARLTSMFIQFCIYVIYMLLMKVNVNEYKAFYNASIFAVFAAINIPIIKFSVYIWNTIHQKSSIITASGPKIHIDMLWPLFTSLAVFVTASILATFLQLRLELLELRKKKQIFKPSYYSY